ncbi:hypothetical protein NMY22_g11033 [Coprinellus aureogranulatus]|nr:hypothetical protein NMY22_g11033 [Coprinellus aureogranulatus]
MEPSPRGPLAPFQPSRPHERVPPEILGEIFQFAVLDSDGYTIRSGLVWVCLVCKQWYEAALLDHQLWGWVVLTRSKEEERSYQKAVTWLSRCPPNFRALKVPFNDECWCWDTTNPPSLTTCDNRVLSRLLRYGPQLHRLDLKYSCTTCFDRLCHSSMASNHDSWKSIQSLKLTISGHWEFADHPDFFPLRNAPLVQSLDLNLADASIYDYTSRTHILQLPSSLLLGLSSLSITFGRHHPQNLSSALSQCGNLENLTIAFGDDPATGDAEPEALPLVTLPLLRALAVWDVTPSLAPTVLAFLRAPALEELDVSVRIDPSVVYTQKPHAFFNFMQSLDIFSSSPAIHSLGLYGRWFSADENNSASEVNSVGSVDADEEDIIHTYIRADIDSEELIRTLSPLPRLKYLFLYAIEFDAEVFLDGSHRFPLFLPSLEHLELQDLHPDFQLQLVLEYIKDHRERATKAGGGTGRGLRRLTLHYDWLAAEYGVTYTLSDAISEVCTTHRVTTEVYLHGKPILD